jgi:hypothetical protein
MGIRFQSGAEILLHRVQTASGADLASYPVVVKRPGREADGCSALLVPRLTHGGVPALPHNLQGVVL